MRELVLIHGRSQQHKDAAALKREWIAALVDGLEKSHLALPILESAIHFPYYGDTLIDLVNGLPPEQVADIIVKGDNANDEERAFTLAVVRAVGQQAGLTDPQKAPVAGEAQIQTSPL